MRKQLILLFLLGVFGLSFAEERRLLTMEDAILNRNLTPKNYQIRWSGDYLNQYLHKEDTVWYAIDVRTGKQRVVDYVEPIKKHVPHAVLKENNIVWLTEDSVEIPITSFDDKNIVCGREVSRNEFGCMHGLFPSPDNSRLAFYVKDESQVITFPLLDITTRTGTANEIKYPMVGMSSERLRLGVYDVEKNKTIYLNITDFTDERYLTNVTWSLDSKTIYIQVMNREQKELNLNAYDALTGEFKATLLSEKNDQFLEPNKPLIFIDDDRFVYTTDNRDGYYNLYLYSLKKQQLTRLTCVDADVEYLDHDNKYVYYYSAEVSSVFSSSNKSSYVVFSSISSSSISAVSAMSAISAFGLSADIVDLADIADLVVDVEMEIPASLAFWKKVLMVTPVPWAWRQRSYCLSVSAWS